MVTVCTVLNVVDVFINYYHSHGNLISGRSVRNSDTIRIM